MRALSFSGERTRSGNRAPRLRLLTDFLAVASTDLVLWRLTTNQLRQHENHIPRLNPETARQLVDTHADEMRQLQNRRATRRRG